ncbi:ABC transporter ATP-binding protein [Bifidobacterium sp.]|uniref:ABC transporter ATP-binding protein n=1 Tax=Bifidobacterium sp. TaxID=41200 RepID=UPI0039EA1EDD
MKSTPRRHDLLHGIEQAAGTSTGVSTLILLYGLSAIAQGIAFVSAIPIMRHLLGGEPVDPRAIVMFAACVVIAFVAHIIGLTKSSRVSVYAVCDRIVQRIGSKVTRIALGWFDATSAARVSEAISDDVQSLSHLGPVVLPGLISGMVTPLTVAVAALFIQPIVGILLLIVVPLAGACIFWSMKVLHRVHPLERDADLELSEVVLENAALQPVLRSSGQSGMRWDHLRDTVDNSTRMGIDRLKAEGRPSMFFQMGTQLCFAGALITATLAACFHGIDVAVFAVLCLLAIRCVEPLTLAVQYSDELYRDNQAVDAVHRILDAPELKEPDQSAKPESYDIRIDGMGFGYRKDAPIFSGANALIQPGGITALIGPSGAGKSTLAKLIARFWDVDEGSIAIGGIDVRDIGSENVMRSISFVFQNVFLFDTTIIENIRIGRPDATRDEIVAAAHAARLDDVIERLPHGWDSPVGQRGSLLSGGERQRVAIARALLKNSPILILDEITSALDNTNEKAILDTLHAYARDKTVVMIAHRHNAIRSASHVLEIDRGNVVVK